MSEKEDIIASDILPDESAGSSPAQLPEQLIHLVRTEIRAHSGPLPSPEDLAAYEQICPGAADRLLREAEQQAMHRREMERTVVTGNIAGAQTNRILGAVIVLATLLLTAYLVKPGQSAYGFAALLAEIAGIVGIAIHGQYRQAKERTEKEKIRAGKEGKSRKRPAELPKGEE